EFTNLKVDMPHHLHREHKMEDDTELEMLNHKLNEIEENIIFYFQRMNFDLKKIKPPLKENRIKFEVKNLVDAIDQLHEKTNNEIRRLKGYIKDYDTYKEKIAESKIIKLILEKFKEYNPSKTAFTWFKQLNFRIFYTDPKTFSEIEVALEHKEIPLGLDYFPISPELTGFFLVGHKSNNDFITDTCKNATEITNIGDYLTEDGLNTSIIDEEMDFGKFRMKRAKEALDKARDEKEKYRGYIELLENCKKYLKLEAQFRESYQTEIVHLEAFIPTRKKEKVFTILDEKFHQHIRVIPKKIKHEVEFGTEQEKKAEEKFEFIGTSDEAYDYSLESNEIDDRVSVPSLVKVNKIFKPFKIITNMYGVANYNEIDPTPIVGLTYPLLFGLMFGDMGHGLLVLLFGILFAFLNRKKKESTMYDAGFLLMWLGTFAMIGGAFYGEAFGYELPFKLLGNPMRGDTMRILKIFILLGIGELALGFLFALANNLLQKKKWLAFTDSLMKFFILLAGGFIVFTLGFTFEKYISPESFPPYPIFLLIVPTIILFLSKPIGKMIGISYLKKESMGELITEQTMDVGETYLNIFANVASYSRLLALALAHMGLMLMITSAIEGINGDSIIGAIGIVLVFVFGNLLVLLFEAVLAGIHALRLTFYEFFGKFYEGSGIPYAYTQIQSKYSVIEFI
ncbi:MAG: V-type ATP synthase subunit I, partial [Promethearchaeota archaeon]